MISLASLFGLKSKGFHTDIIPEREETPKKVDETKSAPVSALHSSLKTEKTSPQTATAAPTTTVTTKRPSSPTPSPRGYA